MDYRIIFLNADETNARTILCKVSPVAQGDHFFVPQCVNINM